MYDTILFDFDGTICDTAEGIINSVQYSLTKFNIIEDKNELYCFCGPPLIEMFKAKYNFSNEMAQKAVMYFRERYNDKGLMECSVYDGIKELINSLTSSGKRVGLATSKPTIYATQILTKFGMEKYFNLIIGSELDGTRTEKWEVIGASIKGLNADVSKTVMVGDRKYDIIGAHKCGIPCIGVGYGYSEHGELETAGADYVCESIIDLSRLLSK